MDWPRLRQDVAEITDRHPLINTALAPPPNHGLGFLYLAHISKSGDGVGNGVRNMVFLSEIRVRGEGLHVSRLCGRDFARIFRKQRIAMFQLMGPSRRGLIAATASSNLSPFAHSGDGAQMASEIRYPWPRLGCESINRHRFRQDIAEIADHPERQLIRPSARSLIATNNASISPHFNR